METNYDRDVKALQLAMEQSARPGFDDSDIENMRILIRLAVDFRYYLSAMHPWPHFPDDPVHDMMYKIDSIFAHIDSFRGVLHAYGILVGSTATAIDWESIQLGSLRAEFLAVYNAFTAAGDFETKCRLLLDLMKMQIVFAGAFYDCMA